MKVTIEHYVATNNPIQTQSVLDKYGVPKAKNMSDLVKKVHYIVLKHKDFAINDLAKIDTPYKRLILANMPVPAPEIIVQPPVESKPEVTIVTENPNFEKKSNACGCSGFNGEEKKSNCSGGCSCGKSSSMDGEEKSNCSGCDHLKSLNYGIDGKTESKPEIKAETTVVKSDSKPEANYVPLAIFGLVALVTVVVVAKVI